MFKFFYCQFHKVSNKHQLQIFITLNKNKRSNLFKKSLRLFCFYKIKIVPLIPTPPFYKPPYNQNNKNHQSPSATIVNCFIIPFIRKSLSEKYKSSKDAIDSRHISIDCIINTIRSSKSFRYTIFSSLISLFSL